ncbi:MAG: acyl-CoA dehydrogenase family protein [Jatrophihabitans sp.]
MNEELRAAVRSSSAVAAEHAEHCDAEAQFPDAAVHEMRRSGLLGLMVPAGFGGGAGTLADLVEAATELGRVDLSVALIFAMHCQQVVALDRFGGEQLRAEVLPAIAAGKVYLGSVTTTAAAGGHLLSADSATRQDGANLLIDRTAPIVTGGAHADAFLVTMGTPGASSPAQVDLIYAWRDQLRLEVTGDWQPLGMRATESLPMRLHGSIPSWQVIGAAGSFRDIATSCFAPLAHVGWAASWLGTAAGAYSRVVCHLREPARRAQVDPRSELLLIRLATARQRLEVVHALLQHTISVLGGAGEVGATPIQLLVNTVKVVAADECVRVVDELIELVGLRHGYLTGSPLGLERALRDLRSASLNYANDRLRLSNGALSLMDSAVTFA